MQQILIMYLIWLHILLLAVLLLVTKGQELVAHGNLATVTAKT